MRLSKKFQLVNWLDNIYNKAAYGKNITNQTNQGQVWSRFGLLNIVHRFKDETTANPPRRGRPLKAAV